jgi:hypothetical protein
VTIARMTIEENIYLMIGGGGCGCKKSPARMRRAPTEVLQDRIDSAGYCYCPDCHTPVAGVGMGGTKAVTS